jgi:hypothetical protein
MWRKYPVGTVLPKLLSTGKSEGYIPSLGVPTVNFYSSMLVDVFFEKYVSTNPDFQGLFCIVDPLLNNSQQKILYLASNELTLIDALPGRFYSKTTDFKALAAADSKLGKSYHRAAYRAFYSLNFSKCFGRSNAIYSCTTH